MASYLDMALKALEKAGMPPVPPPLECEISEKSEESPVRESASLPEGYRLKYPTVQATREELEEIVARVRAEGYVLLWSTVLEDLIAFYRDEEARSKIPPGFVPYSEAELNELFGDDRPSRSLDALRLIHEAKRCGARVLRLGDGNGPNAEG